MKENGFLMFCEILTESELENFEEKRGNKIGERLVTRKRLWRELGLEKTPVNKILNTTLKTQLKKNSISYLWCIIGGHL